MSLIKPLVLSVWLAACSGVMAQSVRVDGAWARATVAGQKATGAFMTLTAPEGAKLVSVNSPVAGVAEIHEMTMAGGVMKMRAISALELPAGKAVELKPGGHHVMLMDLKSAVKDGDAVPLTLVFEGAGGARQSVELKVPARPLTAAPAAASHGGMKH